MAQIIEWIGLLLSNSMSLYRKLMVTETTVSFTMQTPFSEALKLNH